jgi:hypothetical protein
MRLEYVLLGGRMSLEERRRFDAYCYQAVLMTEELEDPVRFRVSASNVKITAGWPTNPELGISAI